MIGSRWHSSCAAHLGAHVGACVALPTYAVPCRRLLLKPSRAYARLPRTQKPRTATCIFCSKTSDRIGISMV